MLARPNVYTYKLVLFANHVDEYNTADDNLITPYPHGDISTFVY